ncbi:hypothetical protein ACKUS5_19545 [Serratia marcescens]
MKKWSHLLAAGMMALSFCSANASDGKTLMRSAINEGQKARYLESKNVSIYESELQKKHPF